MRTQQFFYQTKGKEQGPITARALQALAASGRLSPSDLVRLDGQKKWVRARSVRGLNIAAPNAVPPVPPVATSVDRKINRARHQMLATWVFGSLLFIFFLGVFLIGPDTLPLFKLQMLAIACALLSGLFAFFLTGEMHLQVKGFSVLGEFAAKMTGGIGVFVLVLIWWSSPAALIKVDLSQSVEQAAETELRLAEQHRKNMEKAGAGLRRSAADMQKKAAQEHTGKFAALDLSGKRFPPDDLAVLEKYTNLDTLFLTGATFENEMLRHLEPVAARLRELRLNQTPLSDTGLAHLADMENLERLDLSDTQVTDTGLRHLRRLVQLKELRLDRTSVTGKAFEIVGKTHSLEVVSLRGSKLTDEGLGQLAQRFVMDLDLGQTAITDEGIEALNKRSGLRRLKLDGSGVTGAGLARLKAALPSCSIFLHLPLE